MINKKNKTPKSKPRLSKSSTAFYVLAVISLLTFIYSMYNVYVYLDSLIAAGQITWAANWSDMFGYYLGSGNGFYYLLFAAILAGIGYIISLMKNGYQLVNQTTDGFSQTPKEESDEELIEYITGNSEEVNQ